VPSPDAILRGYINAAGKLTDDTVRAVSAVWLGLPNYRDSNIDQFVGLVTPLVRGSSREMARFTAAYHRSINAERDDNVPMALLPRETTNNPRGVPTEDVYRRPASSVYRSLARGNSLTDSVGSGLSRLESLVRTDLQLVKTKQSDVSLRAGGFRFYRRVLTGRENCALCTIASTQRYRVGDLMPIHPACDCAVDAVDAKWDPGRVIDPVTLDRTHSQVEEVAGVAALNGRDVDYRNLIINVENSQLGPVLDWRSRYDRDALQLAENLMSGALNAEPGVTSTLLGFADANNAEMVGLPYRIKTRESLYRKIRDEAAQYNLTPGEVQISDALRYTMQIEPRRYGATVADMVGQLRDEGYVLRVKNYWKPNSAYKGVNVAGVTPDGVRFELQFHTPTSYDVKEHTNHPLYEIWRSSSSTTEQQEAAYREMVDNFNVVADPNGLPLIPE
jgi:hypothetical protein